MIFCGQVLLSFGYFCLIFILLWESIYALVFEFVMKMFWWVTKKDFFAKIKAFIDGNKVIVQQTHNFINCIVKKKRTLPTWNPFSISAPPMGILETMMNKYPDSSSNLYPRIGNAKDDYGRLGKAVWQQSSYLRVYQSNDEKEAFYQPFQIEHKCFRWDKAWFIR